MRATDWAGPVYELADDSLIALSARVATPACVSCCDIDVIGDKLCDSSPLTSCAPDEDEAGEVLSVGRSAQEHSGKPAYMKKSDHPAKPFVELCASRAMHVSHCRRVSLSGARASFAYVWLVGASCSLAWRLLSIGLEAQPVCHGVDWFLCTGAYCESSSMYSDSGSASSKRDSKSAKSDSP